MRKNTSESTTGSTSSGLIATTMNGDLFSARDLQQMAGLGLAPEEAARQVELFRNPPPYTRVLRPCRPGDGIRTLALADHDELLGHFDAAARRGQIGKVLPASGAATRMFKDLLTFLATPAGSEPSAPVRTFFANLPRFAFYESLAAALDTSGIDLDEAVRLGDWRIVLRYLLEKPGLGYSDLPKGLLLFHRYPEGPRTPFEEHLVEAAAIARAEDGLCLLHVTISPSYKTHFERLLDKIRPGLEERFSCRFEVSFSTQRHSTDTLAVDLQNRPFRKDDGSLLFRPGGHGALLENLNDLGREGWDIILLKNVDNIVPDDRKPSVNLWRRLLGGCLLSLREHAFSHLDDLEALDGVSEKQAQVVLKSAEEFLRQKLSRRLPKFFATTSIGEQKRALIDLLDRPFRVCGVVRNEGEPGGGPFWVEHPSGEISLQIVETSQIDPNDIGQQNILRASSHFNPVDLVCSLRNRHGQPYDLRRFVDPSTVFISEKSHEGHTIKALEHPGLWNGGMAGWNTVFLEIPNSTFAPVKTFLDLLRPQHQTIRHSSEDLTPA